MNTEFIYLYRDHGNNKLTGRVVLRGRMAGSQIGKFLEKKEYFIPSQVGLKDLQPGMRDFPLAQDDYVWHEIVSIEATSLAPTVPITSEELVARFAKTKGRWNIVAAEIRLGMRKPAKKKKVVKKRRRIERRLRSPKRKLGQG